MKNWQITCFGLFALACGASNAQPGLTQPANPAADLASELEQTLMQIRTSPRRELESHLTRLVRLSEAHDLVPEIVELYSKIPSGDYGSRLFYLSILGEFQDERTFGLLKSIVWQPNNIKNYSGHLDPPLSELESLQGKAVQGIGYLRSVPAQRLLLDVLDKHPSIVVRVEAIASYVWNSKDKRAATRLLREHAPDFLHIYIDMPRFSRGMNFEQFNKELAEWRAQWRANPR